MTTPSPQPPHTPKPTHQIPTTFRLTPPGYRYSPLKIWLPIILETLVGIFIVSMPVWVGTIIEDMIATHYTDAVWSIGALLLLVLFLSFNEMVGWRMTATLMAELERDWKHYAYTLYTRHPTPQEPGHIISIINQDSRHITLLWQSVPSVCGALAVAIMGAIQLWQINTTIAIVSLTGIALTISILTLTSKALEKKADIRRDKISLSAAAATDIATALRTISGLGAQAIMLKRFRTSTHHLRTSQLEYQKLESWSLALNVLLVGTTTLSAIALALRGSLVDGHWQTTIPASQLIAIAGIITMMTGPIWVVQMMLWTWRQAKVARKRIQNLENTHSDSHPSPEQTRTISPVGHQKLHYINPRTSGQTAQEYAAGLLSHLRNQDRPEYQGILASEPNPMIFQGSLKELLLAGTTERTESELTTLLALTDSLEIAHRLGGEDPHHYFQAAISAEGTNLSGGQKQRLALARALAQTAGTLVLCEPLNSVDEPSQKYIYDQLEEHLGHGPLAHISNIFIISTTPEVQRRIDAKRTTEGHQS